MLKTKSASLPQLLRTPEGLAASSSTSSGRTGPLCQGLLHVGQSPSGEGLGGGGAVEWQPFRFTHHPDGHVSFSSGKAGSLEYVLDADWRKPFVALPWKPMQRAAPSGSELHPFTLSYAPLPICPGEASSVAPARRTVLLAAKSAVVREKWLDTFREKARFANIRPNQGHAALHPLVAEDASNRRLASLGHHMQDSMWSKSKSSGDTAGGGGGLFASAPGASQRRRRLISGAAGIFDSHSKLHVVRELLDNYAADPLNEVDRTAQSAAPSLLPGSTSQSSSGFLPPGDDEEDEERAPQAVVSRRLLEKYLDRQDKIERLLEKKTGHGRLDMQRPTRPRYAPPSPGEYEHEEVEPDAGGQAVIEEEITETAAVVAGGQAMQATSAVEATDLWLEERVKPSVCAKLSGRILHNGDWSGGALLEPSNAASFRLTIRPNAPVDHSPVFIGIAPADSVLDVVNFFDVGGAVTMCVGGLASEALIAAMGASGGMPSFHCLGERSVAKLPNLPPGGELTVQYSEEPPSPGEKPEGHVTFFVTDEEGELQSARPKLRRRLLPGMWRPCVLLCMPHTAVEIVELT